MADTSAPAQRRRTSRWDLVAGSLVGLAVMAVALAAAERSHTLSAERRAVADERVLGTVATGLAADLTTTLAALSSDPLPSPASVGDLPGVVRSGLVEVTASGADDRPLSAEDRRDPAIARLLERARDSGALQVGAPVDLGRGPLTHVAQAVYAAGARPGPPTSPEERRELLTGWVLAALDLGDLAEAHLPDGAVARVTDDGTSFTAGGGTLPGRLPSRFVDVGGRRLELTAGDPDPVATSALTVGLIALGLVAGPTAGVALVVAARSRRRRRQELARRDAQVRLIGEVAPLVQQSLELAEVLPAVAVQLTDHFDLAGVRLSAGATAPGQLELFSLGQAPADVSRTVLRPPSHLAAGATLSLGLQRAGRSVAVLDVVAGRDLDASELESLRALSELVAAAIVNSTLYASQQKAVARLRELDTLKTVFLSTASHELRTPVTAIGGFASLLAESWDRFGDADRQDFARRIASNARSLSAVVQDLLDFSLLDRGGVPVHLEEVHLGSLAASVIERLGPVLGDHEVIQDLTDAPAVAAEGNGMERVVTNLLTNAAKFSPAGTPITVTVRPEPEGGGAALVVSDGGPGVPAEERERVFTRFYRGAGEPVVHSRGVGIGLSVVAELVARVHGRVELDDAPGGGARFTVHLPAFADAAGDDGRSDRPTGELGIDDKEAEDAPTG